MATRAEIEQATAQLIGRKLWRCLRAVNMAMFDFGEQRKVMDSQGREKEVGELALHVQCHWRIAGETRVLVGSRDINYPAEYSEGGDIPPEFDWDLEPSRLDKLLRQFFEEHAEGLIVENVHVGDAGSLRIALGGNLSLELFPDDSLDGEHWRLFVPVGREPHLVVRAGLIEK